MKIYLKALVQSPSSTAADTSIAKPLISIFLTARDPKVFFKLKNKSSPYLRIGCANLCSRAGWTNGEEKGYDFSSLTIKKKFLKLQNLIL